MLIQNVSTLNKLSSWFPPHVQYMSNSQKHPPKKKSVKSFFARVIGNEKVLPCHQTPYFVGNLFSSFYSWKLRCDNVIRLFSVINFFFRNYLLLPSLNVSFSNYRLDGRHVLTYYSQLAVSLSCMQTQTGTYMLSLILIPKRQADRALKPFCLGSRTFLLWSKKNIYTTLY